MNTMKKERLSNMELLRIVAIVLIVMMHAVGYITKTTDTTNRLVVAAVGAVGNMGVTLFVLISGYFGIRFRWAGLTRLWLVMLFYSVGIMILRSVMEQTCPSWEDVYRAATPVTSRMWWFMTCYFVLYLVSPFINMLAEQLSRRQLLALLAVLTFFFILSPTFLQHEITDDMHGKGLPNMLTAYLWGHYIARDGTPDFISRHAIWLWLAVAVMLVALTLEVGNIFCRDNNLLVVFGAVCLFSFVREHPFQSPLVNRLATYAFPLYLVNTTILHYLHNSYQPLMSDVAVWPPCLLALAQTLLLALLVETVRRWALGRATDWLCRRTEKLINSYGL